MLEKIWKKGNPSALFMGIGTATVEDIWRFLKKLKRDLPYDPAVLLLGMYLAEVKSLSQRDIYIPCLEDLYLQ